MGKLLTVPTGAQQGPRVQQALHKHFLNDHVTLRPCSLALIHYEQVPVVSGNGQDGDRDHVNIIIGSEFLQLPVGRNCINVRNYQACFLLRVQHTILTSLASFNRTDIYWVLGKHPGLFQGFTQSSHTLGGKPDGSLTPQLVNRKLISTYRRTDPNWHTLLATRKPAHMHTPTYTRACTLQLLGPI